MTTSHLTNPAKYTGQVIGYSHLSKQPKKGCTHLPSRCEPLSCCHNEGIAGHLPHPSQDQSERGRLTFAGIQLNSYLTRYSGHTGR